MQPELLMLGCVWLSLSQRVGRVDGFEQVGLQAVDAG